VTYKGGVESEATMTVTAADAPSESVDLKGKAF
jgi:hypothetical protein